MTAGGSAGAAVVMAWMVRATGEADPAEVVAWSSARRFHQGFFDQGTPLRHSVIRQQGLVCVVDDESAKGSILGCIRLFKVVAFRTPTPDDGGPSVLKERAQFAEPIGKARLVLELVAEAIEPDGLGRHVEVFELHQELMPGAIFGTMEFTRQFALAEARSA